MSEGFLVIDAGSGSVKSFLVSPRGKVLKKSEVLWDRETWRAEKAKPAIIETIRKLEIDPSTQVHGISVTSMREEFILVDKQGDEITYAVNSSSDRHGNHTLVEYGERMYLSSGHWPVPNWIAGAILPWLRDEHPKKLQRTHSMLMISDWVNMFLCGVNYTDGSSACETALFDIKKNDWDRALIEDLGLPSEIFPEVKKNADRIGEISDEFASTASLPSNVPVFMGGADTQCGLLGVGTQVGEVTAVGGTTTPVQLLLDKPIIDPKMRTWSNNHLTPDQWILESNCGYTGSAVRWAKDNLGFNEYMILNGESETIPAGSNGLLSYLGPHVFNAGPPYWEMDKLGDLPVEKTTVGKENPSRGEQARSIIEANCYAVKANLRQVEEISGQNASTLKFCGGNSKSQLWMQIQADVLGLPVIVPEVKDGSAIGTAILAAVGSGFYSSMDEAVENMVTLKPPIYPDPERVVVYDGLYDTWMETRKRIALR